MEIYKKIIEKIGWLRLNVPKNKFAFLNVDFGKEKVRWKQTFDTICLYIGEYAKDKEEYERLCGILLGCHKCYLSEEVPNNIVVEEEVVVND